MTSTTKKNMSKTVKKTQVAVDAEVAVETCQHILTSGKNKDAPCGKKVVCKTTMCSKHTKTDSTTVVDSIIQYVKTLLESGKSFKEVSKLFESKKVTEDIQAIVSPKTKKTKKNKDSTHPKRPTNSYMLFSTQTRQKIKDKNPELKATEISVKLGEMWKTMTDKKKKPFEEQAKQDKQRYEEEMKNYTPESSDSDSKSKKIKETKPKKRTSTAFELWKSQNKERIINDNPDMSPKEKQAEINRIWKELSDEEKKPLQDEAARLKAEKKAETSDTSDSDLEVIPKQKKTTKKSKKEESNDEDLSESD